MSYLLYCVVAPHLNNWKYCPDLSRLRGMTPGDSEAGTVSVSVTGVVAVVVSSREELMKDVVLEAEGLVVTGV